MSRFIHVLAALLIAVPAYAQTVPLQGGAWTPGHTPMYAVGGNSQSVIQDSGTAGGGATGIGLSELLQVNRSGNGDTVAPFASNGNGPLSTHNCFYDAPTTNATGYHYLCLDANAQGGGLITYGAGGGATTLPLYFNINGTTWNPLAALSTSLSATSPLAYNNTTGVVSLGVGTGLTTSGSNLILANPTVSTLGGVESATASTNQFMTGVNTSGVPQFAQPSFSNISGSVAASQLPNPTTSTLGGVEAITAVTSNWIKSISTSGVPALSQPLFSDISGQATLAQFPSITAYSELCNATGSSAVPAACTSPTLQSATTATPIYTFWNTTSDATSPAIVFAKSRSGSTVNSGDALGAINLQGYASGLQTAAQVQASVAASPSGSNIPTTFKLQTSNASALLNQAITFDYKSHLGITGSAVPTASTCTGFSLGTGSSDFAGKVSLTSGTTCSISFGTSFTNAPFCNVTPGSAASTVFVTTTTSVLSVTFGTANTAFFYTCVGN